ncbi:hypothetical protein ElyMa_006504500 [Elysia marginata]|uniref:Uncharacterized protein n=1 Tax=Elysia marginata TaxID=1093978 RepID=A0AAV4I2X7_9GAST|nr:hypothetical protein ElyMa_006504500 [Elysia marginata]
MLYSQRVSAVADLSRIAQKLPSQLAQPHLDSHKTSKRLYQRGYMAEKNEEIVCHRCYIHHLPSKKRFYKAQPKTPPQNSFGPFGPQVPGAEDMESGSENESSKSTSSPHYNSVWKDRSASVIKVNNRNAKVIAPIEKYRFLDRDMCGRDRDLNDTLTPRLVPYEDWKKVVRNVCSQCKKEVKAVSSRTLPSHHRASISKERTEDKFRGRKSESRELSRSRRGSSNLMASRESPSRYRSTSFPRSSQSRQHRRKQTTPNQQMRQQRNLQSREKSRSDSQTSESEYKGGAAAVPIPLPLVKQGTQSPLKPKDFRPEKS